MFILLYIQGAYFLLTGIWPLADIASFVKVTGSKKEIWLVKTTGSLIACIGATLVNAAWFHEQSTAVRLLACLSSVILMTIDIYYVKRGTISSVYLLDAAAQLLILFGWFAVLIL